VNIALHLVRDARGEYYDMALLISGDSDLAPAVREVEDACPGRRVTVAWAPMRKSEELCASASSSFAIGERHLKQSQLPSIVTDPDGYALCQPVEWWRGPQAIQST